MKREGRQHGLVQTYSVIPSPWNNPRSEPRIIHKLGSPPTAGVFTKVSQKPTNHSKFTGKCGRPRCASCHIHPAAKARDKAKGTQKHRSSDVLRNYRLVTWRVVDASPGLNFSGFSATGILNHLASDYMDYDDDEGHNDQIYDEGDYGVGNPDWMAETQITATGAVEMEVVDGCDRDGDDAAGDEDGGGDAADEDDDDDKMSFCHVGFVREQMDGDEGWCFVGGEFIN